MATQATASLWTASGPYQARLRGDTSSIGMETTRVLNKRLRGCIDVLRELLWVDLYYNNMLLIGAI